MDKNDTLSINSITFGKYKGDILKNMLKDRKYCNWLIGEDWFQKNYEYLYNQVLNYNPRNYFLPKNYNTDDNFLESGWMSQAMIVFSGCTADNVIDEDA